MDSAGVVLVYCGAAVATCYLKNLKKLKYPSAAVDEHRGTQIQMNLTCVPRHSSTAEPGYLLRHRKVPLQLLVQSKLCRNLRPFIRTLIFPCSNSSSSESTKLIMIPKCFHICDNCFALCMLTHYLIN